MDYCALLRHQRFLSMVRRDLSSYEGGFRNNDPGVHGSLAIPSIGVKAFNHAVRIFAPPWNSHIFLMLLMQTEIHCEC